MFLEVVRLGPRQRHRNIEGTFDLDRLSPPFQVFHYLGKTLEDIVNSLEKKVSQYSDVRLSLGDKTESLKSVLKLSTYAKEPREELRMAGS